LTEEKTVDEGTYTDCDETDKVEDTAARNHVMREESAPLNEFKETIEMKQTRKMCISDSELSIRNKAVVMAKLKADLKERAVYEKCRLPFENCND
jgi:hypothetical protein